MIKLIRCDDRLIHGQCMVRVINDFEIRRILIIDDFTASNPVLKSVFTSAVPPTVKAEVLSTAEAKEAVEAHLGDSENTLLLMRSPQVALRLFDEVPQLEKQLDIGPMSNRPKTTKVTEYAYLLPDEAAAIKALDAEGIRVYFNQVINQKTVEWKDVAADFQ